MNLLLLLVWCFFVLSLFAFVYDVGWLFHKGRKFGIKTLLLLPGTWGLAITLVFAVALYFGK